ncbi:MAG: hypothetical protein C4294_17570, partial [Nitrospiraceae bacterium]
VTLPAGRAQIMLRAPRFALLRSDENLGFSGGNNLAIDYVFSGEPPADFVFLLNNDARIHPNCLTNCVGAALKHDAALVGAVVWDSGGSEVLFAGSRFPLELFWASPRRLLPESDSWVTASALGAAMMIRSDLLLMRRHVLGYYLDPGLFLCCEETELCLWSARHLGRNTLMVRAATVYHKVAGSSGGQGNPLSYYYFTRNRIHLARTFLPWWLRPIFHVWYPVSRPGRSTGRSGQWGGSPCDVRGTGRRLSRPVGEMASPS